jgi:hypothetical protein
LRVGSKFGKPRAFLRGFEGLVSRVRLGPVIQYGSISEGNSELTVKGAILGFGVLNLVFFVQYGLEMVYGNTDDGANVWLVWGNKS